MWNRRLKKGIFLAALCASFVAGFCARDAWNWRELIYPTDRAEVLPKRYRIMITLGISSKESISEYEKNPAWAEDVLRQRLKIPDSDFLDHNATGFLFRHYGHTYELVYNDNPPVAK